MDRASKIGQEGLRYLLVSAFSFIWIISVSAIGAEVIGLAERLAVAVAMFGALVINFSLLQVFVWPGQEAEIGAQFAATAATSIGFRLLEYLFFLVLAGPLGLFYLAATAISVAVSFGFKFLVYRNIVFRRPAAPNTAEAGDRT